MSRSLAVFRPKHVEVSSDNSTWWEVPAVSGVTRSGGEGGQTQVQAINGTASVAEPPGIPSFEVSMSALAPHTEAMQIVRNAAINQTTIYYRLTTQDETVILDEASNVAGGGLVIATTGVCTFDGTVTPDFTNQTYNKLGLVIEQASKNYVISKITDAGAVTVTPAPTTATTKAVYKVKRPQLRDTGTCAVSAQGTYDADVSNPISGSFTLVPDGNTNLSLVA